MKEVQRGVPNIIGSAGSRQVRSTGSQKALPKHNIRNRVNEALEHFQRISRIKIKCSYFTVDHFFPQVEKVEVKLLERRL